MSILSEIKIIILQSKKYYYTVILGLFVLYLCSGIYFISQNEIGVLMRFGKVIDANVMQGIHYALPWPIDKVEKVPIKTIKRIIIDDFLDLPNNTFYKNTGLASYCITGDNNVINISCVIQYSISNAVDYILNVKDNEILLHNMADNIIIKCLLQLPVDEILTYSKIKIENYIKSELQNKLDELKCGLNISFVELKDVKPPQKVQQAFNNVINAKMEKEMTIDRAKGEVNRMIPTARGRANRMIEEANSYKSTAVLRAEGDTKRFSDIVSQNKEAASLTKKRLYLEFIKEIFPKIENKYIISNKDKMNAEKFKIFIEKLKE
jgi:membrane protease subunit HflK